MQVIAVNYTSNSIISKNKGYKRTIFRKYGKFVHFIEIKRQQIKLYSAGGPGASSRVGRYR